MNELSLFTGAGGGLLGTHHLLGWNTIGMVEIDDYCQKVLRQRQRDDFLNECPIFGDIRAFIGDGHAERYRSVADVITAGFPCQPFSVAGKRLGVDDERNMWPETIEVIRLVRPRFCLLENTPGLLSGGYFGTVLGDLAESGFDARWRVLSAAEVGAPHLRDRVWIVAYRDSGELMGKVTRGPDRMARRGAVCRRSEEEHGPERIPETRWPPRPDRIDDIPRMVGGSANRLDRQHAIGNGQIPSVAATAWRLLTETP